MRQANWHEEGGNARMMKGDEKAILREHASAPLPGTKVGRGAVSGDQPGHREALYPKLTPRNRQK